MSPYDDFEIASEDERPKIGSRYDALVREIAKGKTVFVPCDKEEMHAIREGVYYVARRDGLPRLAVRQGARRGRDGLYIWVRGNEDR